MKRRAAPAAGAARLTQSFSSQWLARRLRALGGPLGGARYCLAYSGGADSSALLAALAALRGRYRLELRALHVNHRLQPAAQGMARLALASARRLGVPCRVLAAPVRVGRGASTEAAARAVRYAAIQAELRPGEWLLLAHHQDDQVETLLLQLLRGAGLAGLAAMPARDGMRLRPLLDLPRAALLEYLRRRGFRWTDDPSNADERFDRNYLRLRVLPLLRARWRGLGATLGRSAGLIAEAQDLLAELADGQLRAAHDGSALQVPVLRRLGAAQRRNALRRWLALHALPMPDQRRMLEIAGPLLQARHDAQPRVEWRGGQVRRHGDLLYAGAGPSPPAAAMRRNAGVPAGQAWHWRRAPRLLLADGTSLELRPDRHGTLRGSALPSLVQVTYRSIDGRVAELPGGRRLKKLLHSRALPPWRRAAVPLIYAQGRLLAVGDWWLAPQLRAAAAARGARAAHDAGRLRLLWHGRPLQRRGSGPAARI